MSARSLGSRACSFSTCGGSRTTPGLRTTRVFAAHNIAFPLGAHGQRPGCVFRSSIPRPPMPLSTLHLTPRGVRRKTRGQDGSLFLSCGAPSSPTARRFIPTLALPHGHGSVSSCRCKREVGKTLRCRHFFTSPDARGPAGLGRARRPCAYASAGPAKPARHTTAASAARSSLRAS